MELPMTQFVRPLVVVAGLMLAFPSLATDMSSSMSMTNHQVKSAHGVGVIKKIEATDGRIVLAHQPIKELNWPAMTMAFKVTNSKLLKGLNIGQKVSFDFLPRGMGGTITKIQPTN
jgi:Cu(I)/Ag(I) efflux system periplasmic protein CusF